MKWPVKAVLELPARALFIACPSMAHVTSGVNAHIPEYCPFEKTARCSA